MTNKKNRLFTFIISLIPGAGEMYLGFYKAGASIMLLFLGGAAFFGSLFPPMFYLLPTLWFYSFFHTHNLNNMPDDEFYALEDDYLFHTDPVKLKKMTETYKKPLALILILMGISVIWRHLGNGFYRLSELLGISSVLFSVIRYWSHAIPQLAAAFFFIWMGWKLFQGKKNSLAELPGIEEREGPHESQKESAS